MFALAGACKIGVGIVGARIVGSWVVGARAARAYIGWAS